MTDGFTDGSITGQILNWSNCGSVGSEPPADDRPVVLAPGSIRWRMLATMDDALCGRIVGPDTRVSAPASIR